MKNLESWQALPLKVQQILNHPELIQKELAQRSLSEFIKQAWHVLEPGQPYIHGWHIDAISQHLEAVTANQITRLLINVPPGMMKSMATSVFWPAWEWGAKGLAHYRYIGASHSQSLAVRDNTKTRRLVSSEWFQERWPINLMDDQNAKTKFENDKTGFREACAAGSITGSRGDRVIIDDPHSVGSADSDAKRESTLDWFCHAVPTRLNNPDKSAIVVIMQRLHEGDISGYIIAKELEYEHLMLPMEFEPKRKCYTSIGFEDPRTKEGELLFPGRFPPEVVNRDKKVLGINQSAGQFQQSPTPAGGSIFKEECFQYYKTMRQYKRIVISWDTAFKAAELNDPSVATVWGEHLLGYDLLEVVRKRLTYPDLKREAINLAEKWVSDKERFVGNVLLVILIEDKASGQSLIQDLKRETKFNIIDIKPESDKVTRASTCSPQIEDGKVFLKTEAIWLQDYIDEMCVFPNGIHDDQVDSTSQFLNWISTRAAGKFTDLFFNGQ